MRVTRLVAENVKRLKAIDVEFDDGAVIIRGKNAAGKSSVLDAIWFALGGARTFSDQDVIREGQDAATATVHLDGFVVERRWTESGSRLKVTDDDGREYSSPQAMLEELAQVFAFDPLAFLELHPKEQKAKLLEISGYADELEELEEQYDDIYQTRRDTNRDARHLEGEIKGIIDVEEELADEDLPSTAQLVSDLDEAKSLRDRKAELEENSQARLDKAADMREQAQELLKQADYMEESAGEMQAEAAGITVPDIDSLQEKVEQADELRVRVEKAKEKRALKQELEAKRELSEEMTRKLEGIEERKAEILLDADLPEGVGFDEDTVTYQDRPLAQASMSEKLRVAMGIAMHMDPELRILQVRDASLLDDDTRQDLVTEAEKAGFQVFLELVGTNGDATIIIEDGEARQGGEA